MDDLFVIHCTTCRTRLRVREASAIGQILACPQCSSMVLVEPPAGFELDQLAPTRTAAAPAAAASASLKETIADGDFGDVEGLFQAPPSPNAAASAPAAKQTQPAADVPMPVPSQPATAVAPALSPSVANPSAAVAWTPPGVRRARIIATVVGTSLMGVALAIGLAFLVPRGGRTKGPDPQLAQNPTPAPETKSVEPKLEEPPVEAPEKPPEVAPSPMPEVPPPEEKTLEQPVNNLEVATVPVVDPVPALVNEPPPNNDDPLKLNDLRKIAGLLNNGDANPDAQLPVEPAPAVPTSPKNVRARPEMKKIDLPARLAEKITEIEFEEQALIDFLQVISDYSTVPITLDPQSLAWSRITPRHKVKAHLKQIAVSDILRQTLQPFRLEPVVREHDVLLSRSTTPRTIKYPVADLTGGDVQRQADLVEMITSLAAPDSWTKTVGMGEINPQGELLFIQNVELSHAQVVELLERLRVARGLPLKSSFPKEMFSLSRRREQIATKLDHALTLNYNRPTPLVKMFRRWGEEAKVEILFDWQALAEAGWPTDADATCTLEKTPLRVALAQVLEPMELAYRAVNANSLQITSPAAVERNRELELHSLVGLAETPEAVAQLLENLPSAWDQNVVTRFDPISKHLIVLASQPRQEELAQLIDQWKMERK